MFPDKILDTRSDQLVIAFSTRSENAILFRVDSGSSNDYMELQIIDENILMVYNLGTEDHDIGLLDVKVNDGKVHIVRFTRSGPNSTIQVDNHNRIDKHPSGGKQLTVFNSHYKIQIGGKINLAKQQYSGLGSHHHDNIEKPFHGIILGFIYNGYRLLDLAMDGDSRISFHGDVSLTKSRGTMSSGGKGTSATNSTITETGTGKGKMKPKKEKSKASEKDKNNQNAKKDDKFDKIDKKGKSSPANQTTKLIATSENGSHELIYSGEGSGGCFDDEDDDDCVENGDGDEGGGDQSESDEIITPLIISTARSTPSTPFVPNNNNANRKPIESIEKRPCSAPDEEEEEDEDCEYQTEMIPTRLPATFTSNPIYSTYASTFLPTIRVDRPWQRGTTTTVTDTIDNLSNHLSTIATYPNPAPIPQVSDPYDEPTSPPYRPPPPPVIHPNMNSFKPPPTRPTGKPRINEVPLPRNNQHQQSSSDDNNQRYNGKNVPNKSPKGLSNNPSDRTALAVGMGAIILLGIAVLVLIILYVLKKPPTGPFDKIDGYFSRIHLTRPVMSAYGDANGCPVGQLNGGINNHQHDTRVISTCTQEGRKFMGKKKDNQEWYV